MVWTMLSEKGTPVKYTKEDMTSQVIHANI